MQPIQIKIKYILDDYTDFVVNDFVMFPLRGFLYLKKLISAIEIQIFKSISTWTYKMASLH